MEAGRLGRVSLGGRIRYFEAERIHPTRYFASVKPTLERPREISRMEVFVGGSGPRIDRHASTQSGRCQRLSLITSLGWPATQLVRTV